LKIALLYIGASLSSYGFRVVSAVVKEKHPDMEMLFLTVGNTFGILNVLKGNLKSELNTDDFASMGAYLAEFDVAAIACMSEHASVAKEIIAATRKQKSQTYVVWGGIHAISDPKDAIPHADAVCTSEGEATFPLLLEQLAKGTRKPEVESFWFNEGGEIRKCSFRPLVTSEEMDSLPLPLFGENERLYHPGKGFLETTANDYIKYEALTYRTVWTRGCPFRCTYCGNTRLLEIDQGYGKLRHASVDHLIAEINNARQRFPHINYIAFHDDCLIGLPAETLQEFADRWRKDVGLPIYIGGVTPAHIKREKLEILLGAGLWRMRTGIQSGSDKMLKFYKRPNRPGLVKEVTDMVGEFAHRMMPPVYDMILDAPVETKEDVEDTIKLIQYMPRPFALNVFSLRYIPNTELGRQLAALDLDIEGIDQHYSKVMPTFANALFYLVATVRLPEPLFKFLLRYAKPYRESSHAFGPLVALCRLLYLMKRGFQHIWRMDFSIIFGKFGWLLFRLGLLRPKRPPVTKISQEVP